MILRSLFGGDEFDRNLRPFATKTYVLDEIQPEIGQGLNVRQVFAHFQNLNLRVLIDDLRYGQVARGHWSSGEDLCPLAHGLPSGQAVGVLRFLSQAVDLPRVCRRAAQEMGVPPRFLERFILSWDFGTMSREWLLHQLETLWAERQADADMVQRILASPIAAD